MEFKYTASIWVNSSDLHTMYKRVKKGENFDNVFNEIMARYDDCDYYASDYIKDDVRQEIERRINQSLT